MKAHTGSKGDKETPTVVFFSDAAYAGGAERYLYLLASAIDRSEFRPVAVLCGMRRGHRLRSWMMDSGIETVEVDWGAPMSPGGMHSLYVALRSLSPSIFHMNLPGPFDAKFSLAAPVAKAAGALGVVSTEHLPMIPSFPKARMLKGFSTRFVDRVITVSRDNAGHLERLHRIPPDRITTVYNGVPDLVAESKAARPAASREGDGTLGLLAVGSVEERKGHRVLFEAMRVLPETVSLMVAGDGPLKDILEKDVRGSDLSGRVVFLGQREDVVDLMLGADLLVVPSFLEATPYVILEAFSAGLPVVASGIYGIPELVSDGETGYLVPPGDAGKLADAIRMFIADRRLAGSMSSNCRAEYERRFTLERCVRETMSVYDRLLQDAGRGGRR